MSRKILVSVLAILLISSLRAQENDNNQERYITDQLRLSLYKQADSQSKVIQTLVSGDKLMVEEVAGPYAKVVTSSGNRGWVKRGYLEKEPTAGVLLEELEQNNNLLQQELERLNDSKIVIDQYETDMGEMSQTIDSLKAEKQVAELAVTELQRQAEVKQHKEQAQPVLTVLVELGSTYWHFVAVVVLSLMLIGIIIGRLISEAVIKKKFHGIKVW
ncbi:MAG: SH3 domain-containing protein [Gammaproteobacteria bacterium]|nr:SH3 domain-containing protein [Gammaproteobacteria bacterium]